MAYRNLLLAAALLAPLHANASSFTELATFDSGVDGARPGPVTGAAGTLYGTTTLQGAFGWGNIWAMPLRTLAKAELYNFTGGHDGGTPAGVIAVGKVLYGATTAAGSAVGAAGFGTLFALAPQNHKLTTLYRFTGGSDGGAPAVPVYLGGTLYGALPPSAALPQGGIYGFNLATQHETTVLTFAGAHSGAAPRGLITIAAALYGLASGGDHDAGLLFRIDPATAHETVLYSFTGGADGAAPTAITYAAGALFGTTAGTGSTAPNGTVFRYDLQAKKFTTLYRFTGKLDGATPAALGYAGGFLYGVAGKGGLKAGAGSVFSLNSVTGHETTIYDFSGGSDGAMPDYLTPFNGAFYGTALTGGQLDNSGSVFQITP